MGCGDTCPVFPGKRYLDWDLADPAGQALDDIRPIRDDIESFVQAVHRSRLRQVHTRRDLRSAQVAGHAGP
jgi:hypothetical protein